MLLQCWCGCAVHTRKAPLQSFGVIRSDAQQYIQQQSCGQERPRVRPGVVVAKSSKKSKCLTPICGLDFVPLGMGKNRSENRAKLLTGPKIGAIWVNRVPRFTFLKIEMRRVLHSGQPVSRVPSQRTTARNYTLVMIHKAKDAHGSNVGGRLGRGMGNAFDSAITALVGNKNVCRMKPLLRNYEESTMKLSCGALGA